MDKKTGGGVLLITIFNRREVFITYDSNEQLRIRNLLRDKNIEHYVKCKGRNDFNRGRTGSFGIDMSCNYEYKIYVRQKDYEKAKFFINRNR